MPSFSDQKDWVSFSMTDLQAYFRDKVSQPAYELFPAFARFEYAMKKGGYRRENYPDAA